AATNRIRLKPIPAIVAVPRTLERFITNTSRRQDSDRAASDEDAANVGAHHQTGAALRIARGEAAKVKTGSDLQHWPRGVSENAVAGTCAHEEAIGEQRFSEQGLSENARAGERFRGEMRLGVDRQSRIELPAKA